ncbi:uncharacterized protein PV09_05727 [Verruconis gallopava]|uniref:Transcriptional coactivator HFI1/ADA1 n=1 Tax=Verruconis gallopava TaxID=253628 RepID=A0A0D1YR84_9PEZI|nr:uncharacterized protein PV09_05727 [Verruconis gallopava]KIW03082.1 hypothetical protein PV09_05727 [Verruconis gallopava]
MTSLSRTDSLGGGPLTPTMSSKSLNGSLSGGMRLGRAGPPRIDLEPIYTQLKAAIGENMNLYRDSIGAYMMGRLNQEELSLRIDPFIYSSASTTHLHNQLLAGIYANSMREPPETEIAPFVAAHDKPTTTSGKPASGDAAEQRLKLEIMALPARERHRLKQLADSGYGGDEFQRIMKEVKDRGVIKPPDVVPAGAGGFNKTNWELEISKRFELPLFSESNEFPDADMVQKRMVPICYQEGLAGGCNAGCSDLVNIAAEMFVKQLLTECFRRVRSNGANYIQTHAFKKKLEREEEQLQRGVIKRDSFGLLPCEQEVERHRPPFGVEDLRFALSLGNSYMAQNKILTAKIFNRALQRQEDKELGRKSRSRTNGFANGARGLAHHPKMERTQLDDTLDEILDVAY